MNIMPVSYVECDAIAVNIIDFS